MKNSRIEIEPSGARLGVEIHNINLTEDISDEEKETLRQALNDYEVIFFPDQNLDPNQQKEATRIFGPLLPSYTFFDHLDDDPEIEIVINDENNPPTGTALWHADLTWSKEPPGGTSLYARTIPKGGKGNTIWASMSSAYDSLSDRMKTYLEGLEAVHSWDLLLAGRQQLLERGGDKLVEHKTNNPPIAQPMVRTHPLSGKKILNVNPTFTHHIVGLSRLESDGILQFLFTLPARPENQVRHKWHEGTLAVWDNTATQHSAVDDFFPEYRELTRVTFGGHGKPR
jgi:taurine dioxygenase